MPVTTAVTRRRTTVRTVRLLLAAALGVGLLAAPAVAVAPARQPAGIRPVVAAPIATGTTTFTRSERDLKRLHSRQVIITTVDDEGDLVEKIDPRRGLRVDFTAHAAAGRDGAPPTVRVGYGPRGLALVHLENKTITRLTAFQTDSASRRVTALVDQGDRVELGTFEQPRVVRTGGHGQTRELTVDSRLTLTARGAALLNKGLGAKVFAAGGLFADTRSEVAVDTRAAEKAGVDRHGPAILPADVA